MAKESYRRLKQPAVFSCCPSCGQTVPSCGLRVDLQTNIIRAGGLAVRVQPRTAELVHVLLERFPNYVPREVIIARVWANDALDRTVDAQATRARVALKALGYRIESFRGSGYRVAKDAPVINAGAVAVASLSRLQYVRAF